MRKSLILMLIATLLVGAFLVSCNSDISSESSNGDKLVKVTIAGNAKGISAVSTSDDADNYYWYYSARKDDSGVYRTGKTDWKAVKANNETGLSGADLGYFSSGAWKFSFYGYTTAQTDKPENPKSSSVYYQEDNAVTVVKTTDTPTYVSVTLEAGTLGETATVVINQMNWKYTPASSTLEDEATFSSLKGQTATIHFAYLNGTDCVNLASSTGEVNLYTSSNSVTSTASQAEYAMASFESFTYSTHEIPASPDGKNNTIKFWVTIGSETVGDEDTINVVAYSRGIVTLSIDSNGVAVADNEALNKVIIDENTIGFKARRDVSVSNNNKSAAKTIVTTAAPSTDSNVTTSITFPEGALVAEASNTSTYAVEMDVVVYQTEAAQAKFVIEETTTTAPSTFAGLDISATLTTTTGSESSTSTVSQFSDNTAVTIRTYIAKNLTGVQVVYNGSAGAQPTFSGVSFNSEEDFADSSYETGYVKSTGLLVFKTTHFSEFFVGANEKVYDKKTNSGYTVAAFNNLSASDISDHEFILLDASVANDIDDSRDVFNANFKWSVVHSTTPDTRFSGGYGTKLEPYMIGNAESWNSFYAVMKEAHESFGDNYPAIYFVLGCDINLNGVEINVLDGWDYFNCFKLDGKGYSVSNISSFAHGGPDDDTFVIWPRIKNSLIKNITFNYAISDSSSQSWGYGMCYVPENTTFSNVSTTGSIYALYAAWISAFGMYPSGNVYYYDCVNAANLTGFVGTDCYIAPFGSHCGRSGSKIYFSNCKNYGTVAGGDASGFVGMGNPDHFVFVGDSPAMNYGSINGSKYAGHFQYSSNGMTYSAGETGNKVTKTVAALTAELHTIGSFETVVPSNYGDSITFSSVENASSYWVRISISVQRYNYDNGSNANKWSGSFPITVYDNVLQSNDSLVSSFIKAYVYENNNSKKDYQTNSHVSYDGLYVPEGFSLDSDSVDVIIEGTGLYLVKYQGKTFYYLDLNEYDALLTTEMQNDSSKQLSVTFNIVAYDSVFNVLSTSDCSYKFSISDARSSLTSE